MTTRGATAPSLLVLFGPPAVGKTAVGREIEHLTDFKLFHAHMAIDFLTPFFDFGSPAFWRLHRLITFQVLEEAAQVGSSMIVTTGWRFDRPADTAYNLAIGEPFFNRGGTVHYVELWAPLDVRIERNQAPERAAIKDTDWATDRYLAEWDEKHRTDSRGELPFDTPVFRLDTTTMSASEAAARVVGHIAHAP